MAKHPHRLQLHQKKTWRCMLPGCRYFIHVGLQFTLPGQQANCGGCNETFTVDEASLTEDTPRCDECRARAQGTALPSDIEAHINRQIALSKAGVKSEKELTPMQRNTMKALGILPDVPEVIEKDEVEVIEPDDVE